MTTRQFHIATAVLVFMALMLRVIYQFGADHQVHIAGDINDYVQYAWNLGQHGVYSSTPYDPDVGPQSDNFRPPGYALFLLLAMKMSNFGPSWINVAYAMQILFSTATVLLTIVLAKEWMKPGLALTAGLLMAFWPHHIVFASTLLTETILGFSVILGLWLAAVAQRRNSIIIAVLAGIAFGFGALVNSLMLLFPIVVAIALITYRQRNAALTLLLAFLLLPTAWWLSSPTDTGHRAGAHRATINLVQGSWPIYHAAWRARAQHEQARQLLAAIHSEIDLVSNDPRAGLEAVRQRVSLDPAGYARWYLLEKPYLLWAWDIQLGWGGVHFLPVETTPLERHPVLSASHRILKSANPLFFVLGTIAATILSVSWLRGRKPPFSALLVAVFTVYVTALHSVLQAEPRYSIPYRPEQLLMACAMLGILIAKVGPHVQDKARTAALLAKRPKTRCNPSGQP